MRLVIEKKLVTVKVTKALSDDFSTALLQKLSKNKDEILYSYHFWEILLEFFFVLLANYYLLTKFILRQVIWSKIS